VFSPREIPAVVRISDEAIAIMGGKGDEGKLNDVIKFNVKSKDAAAQDIPEED